MNSSTSELLFFDNFPIIIISTVYPTFFIVLCLFAFFRYLSRIFSFSKSCVIPIEKIASKFLAININSNIAEIPKMKPAVRLLADTIDPMDITNQSSTFYRMKIYDLGTDFAMSFVQTVTYPYPQFSEYLSYHMLECSCLKAEADIVIAQQAIELYNQAVIGPSEFSYTQINSFKDKLDVLNTKLCLCNYSNLWK
ncbi:hypothetical protein LOD99_3276 [Oopsacas minuta]|uniref:Uncharacterized protein n=1 Tax=Oopsacas minuta TaxID=111878 RepID=A0AAV7JY21_9METZ|nr:hypothetical protein LOD99_3276 [Oopsacas minuta]